MWQKSLCPPPNVDKKLIILWKVENMEPYWLFMVFLVAQSANSACIRNKKRFYLSHIPILKSSRQLIMVKYAKFNYSK